LNFKHKKLSVFGLPNIFKNFLNIGIFQFASILLQLLAIPLITRKYGLVIFGEIALTTSVAYLLGNFVNYGTNQTAIKDVAIAKSNSTELSKIFSKFFWLRFVVFLTTATIATIATITTIEDKTWLWLSVAPLILSETINPLYFLVGTEKVHWISWGNMLTRAGSLLLIFFTTIHTNQALMMNLFVGVPLMIFYMLVSIYIIYIYKIKITKIDLVLLKSTLHHNFYVTFNGNSALMQQTIFLFFVAGIKNPLLLGAYGIVDKLLGAARQLTSSFSLAIYPRASALHHEMPSLWMSFRKKLQKIYAVVFLSAGVFLYLMSDSLVQWITKEPNLLAIEFVKIFSLVPLLIALNANNVIDLLLSNKYKEMFYISLMVLLSTIILSFSITQWNNIMSLGWYPVLMEGTCLQIYAFYIRRLKLHTV